MPRKEVEKGRVLLPGIPDFERCDNKVVSARYKPWSFVFVVRAQREDSRFCRFRPEIISHTHTHTDSKTGHGRAISSIREHVLSAHWNPHGNRVVH